MDFDPEQTLQPSESASGRGPRMPETIGRYVIERHLGDGGMGRVFLARHTGIDRRVALKLLPRSAHRNPEDVRRFRTEAKTLAKLDHPNIVRVYDFDEAGGECFLGMEFVDGGDLLDRIKAARNGMPLDEVTRVLDELLESLIYAHEAGVIHRDLKPANILMSREGVIKVSDFGLAAVVGEDYHKSLIEKSITLSRVADMETMQLDEGSSASAFAGTLLYMSPEAIQGGRPDLRDDLYAVGVIAYYMLTGRQPGVNYKPPSRLIKGVNRRWDRFVARCLETADERYQNATEALGALRKIRGRKRRPVLRWSLLVLIAAAGGFAYLEWDRVRPYWVEVRGEAEAWLANLREGQGRAEKPAVGPDNDPAPSGLGDFERDRSLPYAVSVQGRPSPVRMTVFSRDQVLAERDLDLPQEVTLPRGEGDLLLEFNAPDFSTETLLFRESDPRAAITVELEPLVVSRRVTIRSTPPGAVILINGEQRGLSPAAIALQFRREDETADWNSYRLTLQKAGFESFDGVIDHETGSELS